MLLTIKTAVLTGMSWVFNVFMWHWKLPLSINIKVIRRNESCLFNFVYFSVFVYPRHKHYHVKLFKFELRQRKIYIIIVLKASLEKKNCAFHGRRSHKCLQISSIFENKSLLTTFFAHKTFRSKKRNWNSESLNGLSQDLHTNIHVEEKTGD